MLPRAQVLVIVTFSLLGLIQSTAAAISKFDGCLESIHANRSDIWLNSKGKPTSDKLEATAVSLGHCVEICGAGPDHFDWNNFSTQFSSWLLPWLALLSQLPFGANDSIENLLSMAIMVGSPMLAAFALAITVLNKRWIVQRFASFQFPHTKNAVIALSDLQQAPFIVTADLQLLTSLVMLPQNKGWWNDLHVRMGEGYLFNVAAGASIVWTIISYVFTIIGSFQNSDDVAKSITSHGRGHGAVWFWLLPVIVGWLQFSPKCDLKKLRSALIHAHEKVFMITKNGDIISASNDTSTSEIPAIFFPGCENQDRVLCCDRYCTAPLYNYARVFSWADSIESIALAYDMASRRFQELKDNQDHHQPQLHDLGPVVATVTSIEEDVETIRVSNWAPQVWRRITIALLLALLLQWGTTGAAIIVNYYTVTYGLGCRSMSEIIYGCASTVSCICLVSSVILARVASPDYLPPDAKPTDDFLFYRRMSIVLRWLGKLLALLNAIFILLVSIFQFSNFLDRCWCNSSYISLRSKAYVILAPTLNDLNEMRAKWIPGLVLAAVIAAIYLGALNLLSPRIRRD